MDRPWSRKILLATAVIGIFAGLITLSRFFHIFAIYSNPSETQTGALTLVGTLTQCLGTIIGVALAVLFITAQVGNRANFSRTMHEIYTGGLVPFFLAFSIITLICDVISIAIFAKTMSYGEFWVLDFNITSTLLAILVLPPIVLFQIRNFNALFVGRKVCKAITLTRILDYHLASVVPDQEKPGRYRCTLNIMSQQHGLLDPLGPIHELTMHAVQNRDRVLLSGLTRLLLQRIADNANVTYPLGRSTSSRMFFAYRKGLSAFRRPAAAQDQLLFALHILHYIVRRARALREEWGGFGAIREMYLQHLADLLEALRFSPSSDQVIELGIAAMTHIEVGCKNPDKPPSDDRQGLVRYFELAVALENSSHQSLANLLSVQLGFLSAKSACVDGFQSDSLTVGLSYALRTAYDASVSRASTDSSWLPPIEDPWTYLWSEYSRSCLPSTFHTAKSLAELPLKAQIALALRFPNSGLPWLDEIIRASGGSSAESEKLIADTEARDKEAPGAS